MSYFPNQNSQPQYPNFTDVSQFGQNQNGFQMTQGPTGTFTPSPNFFHQNQPQQQTQPLNVPQFQAAQTPNFPTQNQHLQQTQPLNFPQLQATPIPNFHFQPQYFQQQPQQFISMPQPPAGFYSPDFQQEQHNFFSGGQQSSLALESLAKMGVNFHLQIPNSSAATPLAPKHGIPHPRQWFPSDYPNNQCTRTSGTPSINVEELANLLEKKLTDKLVNRKPIDTLRQHSINLEKLAILRDIPKPRKSNSFTCISDSFNPRDRDIIGWNSKFRSWETFDHEPAQLDTSRYSSLWNNEFRNSRNIKHLEDTPKLRSCLQKEYENISKRRMTNSKPFDSRERKVHEARQCSESPTGIGRLDSNMHKLKLYSFPQPQKLELFSCPEKNISSPFLTSGSMFGGIKATWNSLFPEKKPTAETREKFVDLKSQILKNRLNPSGVVLTKQNYYCIPTIKELNSKVDSNGQCFVENFEIGHPKFGKVIYDDKINVAGLDLDEVEFSHKRVVIYPFRAKIPSPGQLLNRPAFITLKNYWPTQGDSRTNEEDSAFRAREIRDYESGLIDLCWASGYEFIEFNGENGDFTFKITAWDNNN